MIPGKDECIGMLREAGCSEGVVEHCIAVHQTCMRISAHLRVEHSQELLTAGSLLHDIGRAFTHGIRHAVAGADYLRSLGVDPRVVLIVERHIGGGITPDEARAVGLPVKDYTPKSIEEKVVCAADNITNHHVHPVEDTVRGFEEKGLHAAAERIVLLHEEISELCSADISLLQDVD